MTKPKAIMVDVDGTVALRGNRSPYDWDRVGEDSPNHSVIACVEAMYRDGYDILFVSGRDEVCRWQTEMWLRHHFKSTESSDVFMRPQGDNRPDTVVKRELYDREIRDLYDVLFVLDDRQQVVDMWRELGLTVFQVAPGNF